MNLNVKIETSGQSLFLSIFMDRDQGSIHLPSLIHPQTIHGENWKERSNILDYQHRVNACYYQKYLTPNYIIHREIPLRDDLTITVVRDDVFCGGTKQRAFLASFYERSEYEEFIYVSSWYGGCQVALASAVDILNSTPNEHGVLPRKKYSATIFTPTTDHPRAHTFVTQSLGAKIIYCNAPEQAALAYEKQSSKRCILNNGFRYVLFLSKNNHTSLRSSIVIKEIANFARSLKEFREVQENREKFDECWCAVGSGTLLTALQEADLAKEYHGVCVYGTSPEIGNAIAHFPEFPFEDPAPEDEIPPYPSATRYDSKVWDFVKDSTGNILVWNVM